MPEIATGRNMMPQRWDALWRGLGTEAPPALFDELVAAYAEPNRAYHNWRHIEFCLDQFEQVRALAIEPAMVEIAIWFHDAIYAPQRADNEERSAAWALSALAHAGVEPAAGQRVAELIHATKHNHPPQDRDTALLVDIDLAILGQPSALFEQYEQAIRQEYGWVDEALFRRRRAAILQQFLDRTRIYSTESFYGQYEGQARRNLANSIERLGQ